MNDFDREAKLPKIDKILNIVDKFSATELVIFGILALVAVATALTLAFKVNRSFMVEIPDKGGVLTEGVIGIPRFINPVLATSDVDRDLVALVYSGLMKNKGGVLTNDLASSYSISSDGLNYEFTIRDDASFHDGSPVTADDVVFTIEKVGDAGIKSPKRADWADIAITKISDKQVRFTLKKPYAPFIQNTTLGILPKHLWQDATTAEQFTFSKLNTEPVGSGPYRINNISRDSSGLPTIYSLTSFKRYALGEPYISKLNLRLFPSVSSLESAWDSSEIDSLYGPGTKILDSVESDQNSGTKIVHGPLPYVMAVFWNQNQSSIFADLAVRQALTLTIPRDKIVNDILKNYGVKASSPLPATYFTPIDNPFAFADKFTKVGSSTSDLILEKSGWRRNTDGIYEKKGPKDREATPLEFSLTTSSTNPEFKAIAEAIVSAWNEAGAKVELKVYDSDLGQNIIRPRKFDALLFGEVIGPDLDLYGFWHSSQRLAPGLNIAQYTNSKADKILEDARSTNDEKARIEKYREFESLALADVPAGFVYSPDFVYLIPSTVQGAKIQSLTTPSDRLSGVEDWYINTDHVWKIFSTKVKR